MARNHRPHPSSVVDLLLAVAIAGILLLLVGPARAANNFGVLSQEVPLAPLPGEPLAPQVALQYSSAAGNGAAGVGWDLPWSSIRLDLRGGVPFTSFPEVWDCDPDAWAGRVWLDGFELVPSPEDPLVEDPDACVFRTRPDTFALAMPVFRPGASRVVHDAPSEQPIAWVVVKPDGTLWWYGSDTPDVLSPYRHVSDGSSARGQRLNTEWRLHHVQDRDGNLTTWHPDAIQAASTGALADAREVVLGAITWARPLRVPGADFAYDAQGDSVQGVHHAGAPYLGGGSTGRFQQIMSDASASFPPEVPHYYGLCFDWEERPDRSVSHRSGEARAQTRRLFQASAVAGIGAISPKPGCKKFGLETPSGPGFLRSWRLQYDQGSTGRSRLTRVFTPPGYDPAGQYPGVPASGSEPWLVGDSDLLENPWEFFWTDNGVLDPGGPAVVEVADDPTWEHDEPFWLEEHWQEGGMPITTLQDINGDGAPELIRHTSEPEDYPDLEASLGETAFGQLDLVAGGSVNASFLIDTHQGDGWSGAFRSLVDPVALLESRDINLVAPCAPGGPLEAPGTCDELPADAEAEAQQVFEDATTLAPVDVGLDGFCALLGTGVLDNLLPGGIVPPTSLPIPELIGLPNVVSPAVGPPVHFGNPTATPFEAAAAWCEYRSCAPYCEIGTVVTHPGNSHSLALPPLQWMPTIPIPAPLPVPYTEVDLGLVMTRPAELSPIPSVPFEPWDLVVWERYATTRASAGSFPDSMPEHVNSLLGGSYLAAIPETPPALHPEFGFSLLDGEPQTKVRHVDGLSRAAFSTRINDDWVEYVEHKELVEQGLKSAVPQGGFLTHEGTISDLVDMTGDGFADRVLGGAAILENSLNGQAAVWNDDPLAPKGLALSTELMNWVVWPYDPTTDQFAAPIDWQIPFEELLTGASTGRFDGGDPANPFLFDEQRHYSWISASAANGAAAGASPTGFGSVSGGRGGVSANVGAALGPVSVSFGATSGGGASFSVGMGPISLSPTGVGLGPMEFNFESQSFTESSGGAASWAIVKVITEVLNGIDLPWQMGINPGPNGVYASFVGLGSECVALCTPTTRFLQHTLLDWNADGRPDLLIAGEQLDSANAGPWRVALNHGAGFDAPFELEGIATDYLSLSVSDTHPGEGGDLGGNGRLGWRRSHEYFGLRDMNGDGLLDATYLAPDGGGSHEPLPLAVDTDNLPLIRPLVNSGAPLQLWVKLNTGRGFADPVGWWSEDPSGLVDLDGHHPALSATATSVEVGELMNNTVSYGVAGLRDFNGDGRPDCFMMEDAAEGAGTLRVFTNTGLGFSTAPLRPDDRYGSYSLDTSAMAGVQVIHDANGPLPLPLPLVDVRTEWTLQALDDPHHSAGPVGSSMFVDLDVDGALEWVVSPDRHTIRRFALQDQVPDLLRFSRTPSGATEAFEFAPARDFMDFHSGLSDFDAFPASSQVLVARTVRDGLGRSEVRETWSFDEPRYDYDERMALGFAEVRHEQGPLVTVSEFGNDRLHTGLLMAQEQRDTTGDLWRRTVWTWDDADFALPPWNWHFAPVHEERFAWEPRAPHVLQAPHAATPFRSQTWSVYSPWNGEAVCVQEDVEGDGAIDRAETTTFDEAQRKDGYPTAVRWARTLTPTPGSMLPRVCDRDHGEGQPSQWQPVRIAEYERLGSGRVAREVHRDIAGGSPDRWTRYRYYPNGALLSTEEPVAPGAYPTTGATSATRWRLYDPVVGLHPTLSYEPFVDGPAGPIEFPTESRVCGLTYGYCPPGAYGLPAMLTEPSGRWVYTAYDALGRRVALADPLTADPLDAERFEYERFRPGHPLDDPASLGTAGVVRHFQPIGRAGAPAQTLDVQFVDGLGRRVARREAWVSEDGTPGQRVSGRVEFDAQGRISTSWGSCFDADVFVDGSYGALSELWDCDAPSDPTSFGFDPLGRITNTTRPDGTWNRTGYFVAAGVGQGEVQRLDHAPSGTHRRTESLAGPRLDLAWRFDAETRRWAANPGDVPLLPIVGPRVLEVREAKDALGRTTSIGRTGQDPAIDQTLIVWDGFDRPLSYDDPDRGRWEFGYDEGGNLARKELWDRLGLQPQERWDTSFDAHGRPTRELWNRSPQHPQGEESWSWAYDEGAAPIGGAVCDPESSRGRKTHTWHAVDGPSGLQTDLEQAWCHDLRGRPVQAQQTLDAWGPQTTGVLHSAWEYFQDGEVAVTAMPRGTGLSAPPEWVEVVRNEAGQRVALRGFDAAGGLLRSYVDDARYDARGRFTELSFGNGLRQVYEYADAPDEDQRVTAIRVEPTSPGAPLFERFFDWDGVGNLIGWQDEEAGWTDAAAGEGLPERVTCRYDGIDVLLGCDLEREAKGGGEPPVFTWRWDYDALGNLLREDHHLPGGDRVARQFVAGDRQLLQPASGYIAPINATVAQLTSVDQGAPALFNQVFDAAGRVREQGWSGAPGAGQAALTELGIHDASSLMALSARRSFDWDMHGRLRQVRAGDPAPQRVVGSFWYDDAGQNVGTERWDEGLGASVRVERFAGLGEFTDRDGARDWTFRYRFGGTLVAQRDVDESLGAAGYPIGQTERQSWIAGDHLGSATLITNEQGELETAYRYEPYGRIREAWGPSAGLGEDEPGEVDDRWNGQRRELSAFGLAGTDAELEAYDYGARFYSTTSSKWLPADTVTPDQVWESNGLQYVRGNPLRYVDPDGRGASLAVMAIVVDFLHVLPAAYRLNGGRLWPTAVTTANAMLNPAWQLSAGIAGGDPVRGTSFALQSPEQRLQIFLGTAGTLMAGIGGARTATSAEGLFSGAPLGRTWNEFQAATSGLFRSRGQAGIWWGRYRTIFGLGPARSISLLQGGMPPHGNHAGDQPATLYARYGRFGEFLKWGVSQNPDVRYTKAELDGGFVQALQTGPRRVMLHVERELVETAPGPLNREPWAGAKRKD